MGVARLAGGFIYLRGGLRVVSRHIPIVARTAFVSFKLRPSCEGRWGARLGVIKFRERW